MNYRSILLTTLIFSQGAFAFDKDFKTVNDRVPLEFNYLFDSLKLMIKTPSEKIRMVGLCQDIDTNLGFLAKEHIFLLMKSEVIKDVLEHRFTTVRQFDISTLMIDRLENQLVTKQKYLTPFSLWIWRSMMAELRHRRDMGLITNKPFTIASFEGEKRKEAERFRRYIDYLLPWIDKMDALDADQFNQLSKEVSWIILRRLNDRSILLKRYSSTATGDTKITIFNIPDRLTNLHPEDIKRMQKNDEEPMTLKEEGMLEKDQAATEVEAITPTDMSTVSDDVAKELEKKQVPVPK